MTARSSLIAQWWSTRDRLYAKRLLQRIGPDHPAPSVSLRRPDAGDMWFGTIEDEEPVLHSIDARSATSDAAAVHATIYRTRRDVGAIAIGGAAYGHRLTDFSGRIPVIFDEQARHLGRMAAPVAHVGALAEALQQGGNAVLFNGRPVCLGMTCQRMVLNAELFEKCAEAYVLAIAAGSPTTLLPWLVRYIANGRLRKDQRRAAECFVQGVMPPESRGY